MNFLRVISDSFVENDFFLPICYLWAAHYAPPAANKCFKDRMEYPQAGGGTTEMSCLLLQFHTCSFMS